MKKKHLRSLSSVENWLKKQNLMNENVTTVLNQLKSVIESVPDDCIREDKGQLPPPAEIAGDPLAIALYSDGGCRGNPGPGAYAYLVQNQSGLVLAEGVEFEIHTTNNKMELGGAIRGLQEIKELLPGIGKDALLTKVKVMTDSKYVVDGMKSWIQGWKARGWKKADGKTPENIELWQELDLIRASFMEIEWMWVKGHGGHPQNEYCDRKANEAMDENIR
jgi:ribonuclease HI